MSRYLLGIGALLLSLPAISLGQSDNFAWPAVAASAPTTAGVGWNYITEYNINSTTTAPIGITLGPDGALWFVEPLAGRIGRISTTGVVTEYAPPGGCCIFPQGITAGPDGALWFTDFDNLGQIGRITTSGIINEYPLSSGTCCAVPQAITSGPDGALWFTDLNGIGRITTAGIVTQFPFPFSPTGSIARGRDGALWFTEPNSNRIGRITTTGIISEFPLPSAGNPQSIVAGPDGALWFTDYTYGKIGRITIHGSITEYPLPNGNSGPNGITVGPDEALWFTEFSANKIGRITTSGSITEYPVRTPASNPSGISPGPDGGLWFTQYGTNNIGRAWACGLGLSLAYANTTLDINFDLGVAKPARFVTALATGAGVKQLWSKDIGAIAPPVAFTVPWGPGFPSQGNIIVYSSLSIPTTGLICYEQEMLNTSGTGATLEELQKSIDAAGLLPNRP